MINIEEIEIWKDYDDKYKISSLGKVWNNVLNRELKIYTDKVGYCRVSIHGKSVGLHRIVALTFLDNPLNKPTVNHKDTNKGNNKLDNLEWATMKEQIDHMVKNRCMSKMKHVCIIDTENKIIKIFDSMNDCSDLLNLDVSGVRACCIGRINTFHSFKIRHYNIEDKSFVKTKWDTKDIKPKGDYRKIIKCELNNKTYNSQQKCADDLGILQTQVSNALSGKIKNIWKLSYI